MGSDMFVLDCSIVCAWAFKDELSPYAEQILEQIQNLTPVVPRLWWIEISNVLLMGYKKKRIELQEAYFFLSFLKTLPIITKELETAAQIFDLALLHGLTTYDACYLQICLNDNLPIATLDKKLLTAVETVGGLRFMSKD